MKVKDFINKISMASEFDRIEFFSRGKWISSLTKKDIQLGCICSWTERTVNMFEFNGKVITVHLKPIE